MDDGVRKPSFLVYYDNEVIVLRLPDDEAGQLFKSLFPYGRERIKPDFDKNPALAMAFDILSMAIDRDKERYERRCEANRENGRKGGLTKASNSKQSLANGKRGLANLADKDMDMDKHMEKEMHMDSSIDICPDPEKSTPEKSGILLPLNDSSFYDVPLDKMALWRDTYPAVDVERQLKRIAAWLDSNHTRRKTRRGIERFVNNWLSREQDEGGIYKNGRKQQEYDVEAALAKHRSNIDPPECPDGPFQ